MKKHRYLMATAAGGILALALAVSAASATTAAEPRTFHVPAGELKQALDAYVSQSGVQLFYRVDQVRGVRSKGANGSLAPEDALARLLAGTPFRVTRTPSGAVMIVRDAAAPQGDAAPVSANDDPGTLEEVIVTATRREETVRDLPMSITALSGSKLERENKDDLADYIRTVPGVNFKALSGGLNTITIRGVTGGFQRAKSPVSFYIDDMPIVSDPSASPDLKTFDIDRVEVLRGPQGTLFGESAIGGVIRVISKKPDLNDFSGHVRGTVESYAHGSLAYGLDGAVNVPIVQDKFAVRASVSRRAGGGFIDNIGRNAEDQNDDDYTSLRVTGLLKINEQFDVSGTAIAVKSTVGAYPTANRNYEQNRPADEARHDDLSQFNITANYDFGWAKLTSSSNYYKRDTDRLFDLTAPLGGLAIALLDINGTPSPVASFDQFYQTLVINDKSFAQEFRLVSPGDKAFRWVAGAYYFHTDNFVNVEFKSKPAIPFTFLSLDRTETYSQKALFGEIEWDFAPRWTVIAGVRYNTEDRTTRYVQDDDFTLAGRVFLPALGVKNIDFDYKITTPKLALRFKPTENTQIYGSVTRGFRGPGGNTQFSNAPGENNDSFDAETLWAYELGAKGTFLNNALAVEAAVFSNDWTNRQETANPTAPITQQFVANIGDARTRGFEIAVDYRANANITIGGNFSYLETEVTSSSNPLLVGTELLNQPRQRGSAYIDWRYPMANGLQLTARAEATSQSSELFSPTNRHAGYTLINASVGVRGENWSASLYGKNLGDKYVEYYTALVGDPRVVGLSFDFDF
jgi:iron complex outermembrane receptor protein